MIDRKILCLLKWSAVTLAVVALGGCARGAKVLKQPYPQPVVTSLSTTSNDQLAAKLDWVIIREGPGAWATRADWDEYLLTVTNDSTTPVTITGIAVFDSLGTRIEPGLDRQSLVRASRETAKRYKEADIEVHAGLTGAGMFATGTALFVAGGYGLAATLSIFGATSGGLIAPASAGAVLAAPVLMVGSVVRGVNNIKVNTQIKQRQTGLPLTIYETTEQPINIFYPITPSPGSIEISYADEQGSHMLVLDTNEALKGLHLESLEGQSAAKP